MKFLKLNWQLLAVNLLGFWSLALSGGSSQPNIIWLNCEDLSPMLGAYGDVNADTPNLDQIAKEGVLYKVAYATAPICAPSRSTMITGVYATSIGTQHLRSEIERPAIVKTVPEYLKQAGYFTTNYAKTDYNFDATGLFEYQGKDLAPWRNRGECDRRPFYSFFVFGMTHEGSGNRYDRYLESIAELPKSRLHDPEQLEVPPYYPNTEESRTLWARYYDCATALDNEVGKVLSNLKEDGLYDDTIILFFSDHGNGMPRYKRWLNHSGLHVPFIVYVPPKYKHLMKDVPGSENCDLINFSDLAPSTLMAAGVDIPQHMQGIPIWNSKENKKRKYMIGARSRADNMYEVSRSVRDDRYLYVRHYMPHLPYIQPGYIFSDKKLAFKHLREERRKGNLPPASEVMWHPKPVEELYDLESDPYELSNLAEDPTHAPKKAELREALHNWMFETRDAGFLPEPEMMIRGSESTVFEMAQDPKKYDLESILDAAEMVGIAPVSKLIPKLNDPDSGVRYWSLMGLRAVGQDAISARKEMQRLLHDPSPSVAILAAETLAALGYQGQEVFEVFEQYLLDDRPWVVLYAARSIELMEDKAKPLIPALYRVLDKHKKLPGSERNYRDGNFSSFISWSVKWALHYCGEEMDLSY